MLLLLDSLVAKYLSVLHNVDILNASANVYNSLERVFILILSIA